MLSLKASRHVGATPSAVSSNRSGIKTAKSRAVLRRATVKEDMKDPEFNISKAVVLGAAAFGAYLEPASDKGIIRKQKDGTCMRFFDSGFVEEGYSGVLELTNLSAKVVTTSDWNSKSDVYITASLGDSVVKTSTKWNNEDPVFDESLDIWVPKGKALDDITISVFDDDHFRNEDDFLGSSTFNLDSRREESNSYELKMKGKMAGECVVFLTATYLPFGGVEGDKFLETVDEKVKLQLVESAPEAAKSMEKSISQMGVPGSVDLLEAWDELCNLYDSDLFNDKRTCAFITNPGTGTQAFISRDISERKVVVAFRGTEQTQTADLLVDMDIRMDDMDHVNVADEDGGEELNWFQRQRQNLFKKSEPKVHSGFYRSWCSVRETVLRTVDRCTGGNNDWHIYVTGHSLGGALAVLCSWELAQRESPEPRYPITMYNYGGPRVGNTPFVDMYEVKDSWRVHNENDIVAQIPVAGVYGYRHVETGVRILDDGKGFVFTNALNEDVEVQGGSGAKWSPANIMTEIRESVDDVTELLDKQSNLVNAVKSGEAVAAHMEDFYVEGLTNCMEDTCDGDSKVMGTSKRAKACVARSRSKSEAPVQQSA